MWKYYSLLVQHADYDFVDDSNYFLICNDTHNIAFLQEICHTMRGQCGCKWLCKNSKPQRQPTRPWFPLGRSSGRLSPQDSRVRALRWEHSSVEPGMDRWTTRIPNNYKRKYCKYIGDTSKQELGQLGVDSSWIYFEINNKDIQHLKQLSLNLRGVGIPAACFHRTAHGSSSTTWRFRYPMTWPIYMWWICHQQAEITTLNNDISYWWDIVDGIMIMYRCHSLIIYHWYIIKQHYHILSYGIMIINGTLLTVNLWQVIGNIWCKPLIPHWLSLSQMIYGIYESYHLIHDVW
jgi:hypothetical protein